MTEDPQPAREGLRDQDLDSRLAELTAEAEAARRELEAFSYAVSHDLRAPLRAIHGFSSAVLEDYAATLDPRGQDYLRRIAAAADRMNQMLDAFLGLSRTSRSPLLPQAVDLVSVARAALASLQEREPDRRVLFEAPPTLLARGDLALLRVAIENLVGNAWKFSARKDEAHIALGRTDDRAYFIRDDGVGFEPNRAGELFTPFRRLHAPADFPGVGIGLATVQRIVRRHGGRVWAEGRPGQGATFYFSLSEAG
jgi:signal transduction histidine kinase